MTHLSRALIAVAVYFGVVCAVAVLSSSVPATNGGLASALWRLFGLELLLLLICVVYVRRYSSWTAIGFGRLRWRGLFWLLPAAALLWAVGIGTLRAWQINDWVPLRADTAVLIVAVPIMIGFTEEVMFRGILLRAALQRLPVFSAMLLSAVLFGLLHGASAIVQPVAHAVAQQIAFAFFVGVFLAPVALRAGSLWVVIIWHALWDMLIYASHVVGAVHPYVLIGILIQALISIVLWKRLVDEDKTRYRDTS